MIKKEKVYYFLKVFISMAVLLLNTSIVNASENSRTLDLNFNIVEENIKTTLINENGELNIKADCEEYNENSYSYLYQSNNDNWSAYNSLALQLENKSENSIMMNLQIESKYNGIFNLKEDSTIFFKSSENDLYRQGEMLYSNIEIPASYKGTVYIGFDNLVNKENNTPITSEELQSISSWGMTIVPSNEGENILALKKIEVIKKEALTDLEYLRSINIIGNNQVQIPLVGESIEDYKVEGGENVKFSLAKDYEGVTLTEEGQLIINDEATAGKVIFQLSINDQITCEKVIKLVNSWAFEKSDEDGVPYGLLSPEESPTVNSGDKFRILESSVLFIKIFLVSTVVICIMIYAYWKKKHKHVEER